MAFKAKTPGKGMGRSKPLQSKTPMKAGSGFKPPSLSPAEQRKAQQKSLQKTTLQALEKARQEAAERGVDLSQWEDEFLSGVAERVQTYGRAFADPDKGAAGGTLSLRQGLKLREIRKKAAGAKPK
ncbi:MAG: hypothetical protein ACXU8U_07060 [Asticcacaulis sp.]